MFYDFGKTTDRDLVQNRPTKSYIIQNNQFVHVLYTYNTIQHKMTLNNENPNNVYSMILKNSFSDKGLCNYNVTQIQIPRSWGFNSKQTKQDGLNFCIFTFSLILIRPVCFRMNSNLERNGNSDLCTYYLGT